MSAEDFFEGGFHEDRERVAEDGRIGERLSFAGTPLGVGLITILPQSERSWSPTLPLQVERRWLAEQWRRMTF